MIATARNRKSFKNFSLKTIYGQLYVRISIYFRDPIRQDLYDLMGLEFVLCLSFNFIIVVFRLGDKHRPGKGIEVKANRESHEVC